MLFRIEGLLSILLRGKRYEKSRFCFLRMEIYRTDVMRMVDWMNNANVTKYLNEAPEVARSLDALLAATPEPMLRFHFNRSGRFYLICHEGCESIGFVKLLPLPGTKAYEIVYVIGEEALWGHGLGAQAVHAALAHAFGDLQAERVIAKIMPQNLRSIHCVHTCGFRQSESPSSLIRFEITLDEYLHFLCGKARQ